MPLGQPFSVHDPLWAWGSGRNLTSGDGSAIPTIVAGLFFDGVTLLLLYVLVVIVRGHAGRPPSPPAAFRKLDAVAVLTGPLLPVTPWS